MNRDGYKNLCRLVSTSYEEGFHYKPRVDKELLRELNGGLIALSGCLSGEVAHSILTKRPERARQAAQEYATIVKTAQDQTQDATTKATKSIAKKAA